MNVKINIAEKGIVSQFNSKHTMTQHDMTRHSIT